MKSIDHQFVVWQWINAFFSGVSRLGIIAIFAGVIQTLGKKFISSHELGLGIIVPALVLFTVYLIISQAIQGLRAWKTSIFHQKVDTFFEKQIVEHVLTLDLGRLSDPDFQFTKESAERKGQSGMQRLWELQIELLTSSISFVLSLGVVMAIDPLAIILFAIPVVPQLLKNILMDEKRRQLWKKQNLIRRKKYEYEWYLTNRRSAINSKLFRFTSFLKAGFDRHSKELFESKNVIEKQNFLSSLLVEIVKSLAVVASVMYIGRGALHGHADFGRIFMLFGTLRVFMRTLGDLSNDIANIHSSEKDAQYLEKFLEMKPLIDERGCREIRLSHPPKLQLENVSFRYPSQEVVGKFALKDCSMVIEPYEKVAIVGLNGSGKTTIARMLAKVFVPESGLVRVGGTSINHASQESLLRHIFYAGPAVSMPDFELDIAIAGAERKDIDFARLIRAAKVSGANEFVESLPAGYQTQMGEDWPGGVSFSSGQLQRITLTAALYRLFHPEVHVGIFDEPMANCDQQSRDRFYRSIQEVEGKTIIVIAHDPLYLHYFRRVIVMEHGRMVRDLRDKESIILYRNELALSLSSDL